MIKSASASVITAGSPVTYTFKVVNTKEVPISDIALTDDKLGVIAGPDSGDTDNDGVLDVGEEWIYTKTTNLFATTTNIATVEGNDPAGALLDATSTAVTVKVTTNGVPEFPSLALPVGMILGFAFVAYTLGTTRKD